MASYLFRRSLVALASLAGATFLTFLLIFLVPGDPAEMVAEARFGHAVGEREVEIVRATEGFHQPLPIQYFRWLRHLLSLDLGYSLINRQPVLELIRSRLPATLLLAFASLLLSLALALPAGLGAALKKDTWLDTFARLLALLGVSIPGFWLSYLLIMFFSLHLKVLPVSGYGGVKALIMPSLALGLGMTGLVARLLRASLLEVQEQEYLWAARANGLRERKILYKYALKNALIPVLTVIGLQLGTLLSGMVIIESIFGWPGLGKLLLDGIFNRDFPVVQGCVLVIAAGFICVNVAVDLLYAWLDPRIRWAPGG